MGTNPSNTTLSINLFNDGVWGSAALQAANPQLSKGTTARPTPLINQSPLIVSLIMVFQEAQSTRQLTIRRFLEDSVHKFLGMICNHLTCRT